MNDDSFDGLTKVLARSTSRRQTLKAMVGGLLGMSSVETVMARSLGCGHGQTICHGHCTNVKTDRHNCGTCGHVCHTHTFCFKGHCVSRKEDEHKKKEQVGSLGGGTDCSGTICPTGTSCCKGTCKPPAGTITEFSLTTNSTPHGITAGPDGNLWFTEANSIGRITPAGVITEFSIPTANSFPRDITAGPDGNLWFTEPLSMGNKIGRITPAGVITELSTGLTAGSFPQGITAGPDGNLWFTELGTEKIGRISLGCVA